MYLYRSNYHVLKFEVWVTYGPSSLYRLVWWAEIIRTHIYPRLLLVTNLTLFGSNLKLFIYIRRGYAGKYVPLYAHPCTYITSFSDFDFVVDLFISKIHVRIDDMEKKYEFLATGLASIALSTSQFFLDRPQVLSPCLFCRFISLQRHRVWGPPINSQTLSSGCVTKRLRALFSSILTENSESWPLKHRQSITLMIVVRTADAFMKVWRKENYSGWLSITSILHMLWRSSSWNHEWLKNADVASLERRKMFEIRGAKWDPRCYLCKCCQNKMSQSNIKPPSHMQERPYKVRKFSSHVILSSMRPTFYAARREVLCGRCMRCSSDQWNLHICSVAPSLRCWGSKVLQDNGYSSNVCTSPTSSKRSALTKYLASGECHSTVAPLVILVSW